MNYFYVYILRCSDSSYYTGHTDNITARISAHRLKLCDNYTAKRLPVEVVFVQQFASRDLAFIAERRIKGWSRKKKEALINGNWEELVRLSNEKKRTIQLHPSTSSGRAAG